MKPFWEQNSFKKKFQPKKTKKKKNLPPPKKNDLKKLKKKNLTPGSRWPKATSPPQELEIWERSDPNF